MLFKNSVRSMKKNIKIIVSILLLVMLFSLGILLTGCDNNEEPGFTKVTLHPINAITGNEIKPGATIKISQKDIKGKYDWLKFAYEIEGVINHVALESNYGKDREIREGELYHLTSIYAEINNEKTILKQWGRVSTLSEKGVYNISIGFNERVTDLDRIVFTPSYRFDTCDFQFVLEIN